MSALLLEEYKSDDVILLESQEAALAEVAALLAYHSALATKLRYRWREIHKGNVVLRRKIGRLPEMGPALNITLFEEVNGD
jgi:hypothetical protein